MLCPLKCMWTGNFSFHIIKTSRFPWNLVSKKIDLKLSFNKWQFMHGTESGPSLHNSHYTCDDTLKSVTNFSQTCSFLFIDAFFFFISSLAHAHLQHINWFFFFFLHVNQSHPDKNPNKPELHERFVQVNLVLLLD